MTQDRMPAGRAIISALALLVVFCGMAAAEQLYVNESGWWRDGGAFNASTAPIQAAVDAADAGDAIYVWNGSYNENVNVNERLTLEGEGAEVVTVTGAGGHVFKVTADYVNISRFTVTGATGNSMAGIYLYGADHCIISNNNANSNNYGIRLYWYSNNNTITDNTVSNNSDDGIHLSGSASNNTISSNIISNNDDNGIYLYESTINTITDNIATNNEHDGIYLSLSNNNTITGNNVSNNSNNWYGICLSRSSSNIITGNIATNNGCGTRIFHSTNNRITDNIATNNDYDGISLDYSCNNIIKGNDASNNGNDGIRLFCSSNNNIACNRVQNNTRRGIHLSAYFLCENTNNNISYNNIIENGNYNSTNSGWEWQFYIDQYSSGEAKHNYWGTGMNNSTIDASIHDDEEGVEKVEFYPFETEPIPCAPAPDEPPAFTTADAVIALQIAVGSRPPDLRYDVSGDGSVTSLDALMILQAAVGESEGCS